MIHPSLKEPLAKYVEAWRQAEESIKAAEQTENTLNVAPIVELRYAGRRFIEIIDICTNHGCDNYEEKLDEFRSIIFEATQNCIRARNDAIDIIILFITLYFVNAEDKYGVGIIREYFPSYNEIRNLIFQMQDKESESRSKELSGRNQEYDEMQVTHLPRAIELYRGMLLSEEIIEKEIDQANEKLEKKKKAQKIQNYISWGIAAVSAIIGIGSLIVSLLLLLN